MDHPIILQHYAIRGGKITSDNNIFDLPFLPVVRSTETSKLAERHANRGQCYEPRISIIPGLHVSIRDFLSRIASLTKRPPEHGNRWTAHNYRLTGSERIPLDSARRSACSSPELRF